MDITLPLNGGSAMSNISYQLLVSLDAVEFSMFLSVADNKKACSVCEQTIEKGDMYVLTGRWSFCQHCLQSFWIKCRDNK